MTPSIEDADVDLREGEVLGVAGLLGSGRTELARAITGVDRLDAGIIRITGTQQSPPRPRTAISLGVVYSSENRRTEGIVGGLSVRENIVLALQAERGILRRIPSSRQRELAASWIEALRHPSPGHGPAGGHAIRRQPAEGPARTAARPVPARARARRADAWHRCRREGRNPEPGRQSPTMGLSVMFISAELEEVLRVGNRVAILRAGRIVDTVPSEQLTVDSLLALVAHPEDADE